MGMHLKFRWLITTLTPLHIGSGKLLQEGFDFVSYQNHLWVANQNKIFSAMLPKAGIDEIQAARHIASMRLNDMVAAGWLSADDFSLQSGLFHYAMEGGTSTSNHEGQLHEVIKNVDHRPYLPGSSLKGALRSVLLKEYVDPDELNINFYHKKFAAQGIENETFVPNPEKRGGQAPNFNLWRVLKIEDSRPLPQEQMDKLTVTRVVSFPMAQPDSREKTGLDQDFEVLAAGATFETGCIIDKSLFDRPASNNIHRDLGFTPQHQKWFTTDLIKTVNHQANRLLSENILFFEHLQKTQSAKLPFELKSALETLHQLQQTCAALPENEMMLPVGRGTGWLSKTLGSILQDELSDSDFARMVKAFDLGRGEWDQEDYLPHTRMLAQMRTPMGWVKIFSEEVR